MTDRDAFKASFLDACRRRDLSLDETILELEGLVKRAAGPAAPAVVAAATPASVGIGSLLEGAGELGSTALSGVKGLFSGAGGLAKWILGGAVGIPFLAAYAAPHLFDIDDNEIKETQMQDLIDEYKHQEEVARHNAQAARYRRQLTSGRRL